ncbi:hypothetical protein AFEL58S_01978 [Afipia felis]
MTVVAFRPVKPLVTRDELSKYVEVIILFWGERLDTQLIANRTGLPEHLVARWVANFREVMREAPSNV